MRLDELYNLLHDESLEHKIEAALLLACNDIYNEDAATPNHTARLAFAQNFVLTLDGTITRTIMRLAIATAGQISEITDAVIETGVNNVLDTPALLTLVTE